MHPRSKYGLIKLGKGNNVSEFQEKPVLGDWINGGFMVFQKIFFSYLREGETEHPALARLSSEKQLSFFVHDDFWHCMDTYSDVENLNAYWQKDPKWKIWND